MASAIPESMAFSLLSKLPPNSFVSSWKEIRPDNKLNGVLGASENVRFTFRGSPNEFMLNSEVYLCGNPKLRVPLAPTTATSVVGSSNWLRYEAENASESSRIAKLRKPFQQFQASRESCNSGSLALLDNTDNVRHQEYNMLRVLATRRCLGPKGFVDHSSLLDYDPSSANSESSKLENAGVRYLYPSNAVSDGTNTTYTFSAYDSGDKPFAIPLGLYSTLINTHSLIPIGLFSSYAIDGWSLELQTSQQDNIVGAAPDNNSTYGKCFVIHTKAAGSVTVPVNIQSLAANQLTVGNVSGTLSDLRIFARVIKLLDPSTMDAVLSLYEKREMVKVGGVQFPLSLRLNSIAYRFSSYALRAGQADYTFQIPTTDRSVRGYAFKLYNRNTNRLGELFNGFDYPENPFATRLETIVGNEYPHAVVEDSDPKRSSNVKNFLVANAKHSAALFSCIPYYQEGVQRFGHPEDPLSVINNAVGPVTQASMTDYLAVTYPNNAGAEIAYKPSYWRGNKVCYGFVSFENLDRRDSDPNTATEASGKDLSAIGSIQVNMRINVATPNPLSNGPVATAGAPAAALNYVNTAGQVDNAITIGSLATNDWEIIFTVAYDQVIEISPSGVFDITKAIL